MYSPATDANLQMQQQNALTSQMPGVDMKSLATHLLPLIISELKPSVGVEKNDCGCKCAKKLNILQQNFDRLSKTVKGYKEQVEVWKGKVETLQADSNATNTLRLKDAKQMKICASKIEQYTKTHSAMKNSLQQFDHLKNAALEIQEIKSSLKAKSHNFDPAEIEKSQKFINEEFEKLKKDNKTLAQELNTERGNLQTQIQEVARELEFNIKNTSKQSQYTREDCLTVRGIPEVTRAESNESNGKSDVVMSNNCKESKEAIINLCKELNLVVDPDKISIAHRLKKGKYSKGPRPIIVKFTSKELCREVLDLRKTCREISEWAFDKRAGKIYINESLTPEKRKLLYDTKQAVNKHLYENHGVIYVWTHRGDVYVRKSVDGAPKIRVNSQLELDLIIQGRISLDVASTAPSLPNSISWKYVKKSVVALQ